MYPEDPFSGIISGIIQFFIIVLVVGGLLTCGCFYWVGDQLGLIPPAPSPTPVPIPTPYGVIDQFDGEYNVYNIKLPAEALTTLLRDRQPGYNNLSIGSCIPIQVIGDGTYYSLNGTYQLNSVSYSFGVIDWYSVGGINHITYAVRDGNYDLIKQKNIG